ncbi:hypothetical protein PTKIN_Ptkin11bG0193600 [Pterospermum kingtungense]
MLNLYDYNFFGSVLSSLGNLTHLTDLDLSQNNFSGQIPSSISNLKQLSRLDFSWNSFIGQIPDIFVNLTHLSALDLSMNRLSGSIPSSVDLDLTNNQLTGPIDEFQYNSLRTIDLSSNRLLLYPKINLSTCESHCFITLLEQFHWQCRVIHVCRADKPRKA